MERDDIDVENYITSHPYHVSWDNGECVDTVDDYPTFEEAQAGATAFAESVTDGVLGTITCEVFEWVDGALEETGWAVTRGTPAPPYVLYLRDLESAPFDELSPGNLARILDGLFYDADRLGQGMEDGVCYPFSVMGGEDEVGHGVFMPGALIDDDSNGPSLFTWPLLMPDDGGAGDGEDDLMSIQDALAADLQEMQASTTQS